MTIKKTLTVISAATFLCCGVFAGGAAAQFFDMEDDPWASSNDSPSSSESSSSDGGWSFGDDPDPAPAAAPASAKPEKAAKPAKPPKPAKEPKASASSGDGTLNLFGSAGWAFGMGGHYLGAATNYHNDRESQPKTVKDHYLNLGQGLRIEAGVGYMAMLDIEARFSVDFNAGIFAPNVESKYDDAHNNITHRVTVGSKHSYYLLSFKAMLVPQFELLELFDMYVGAGISLDIAGASFDSSSYVFTDGGELALRNASYVRELSPALGFNGVIGALFPLSDAMSFFSEIQFAAVNFKLNKDRLKSYSLGWNNIGDYVYEKDDTELARRPAPPLIPGSTWSLRLGIKYWVM